MNKRNLKLESMQKLSKIDSFENFDFWSMLHKISQSQQSNLWSTRNCKVAFVHLRPETPPALLNAHHPYPHHIHQIFYLYDFIPLSNLPKNTKIITHEIEQILGDLAIGVQCTCKRYNQNALFQISHAPFVSLVNYLA